MLIFLVFLLLLIKEHDLNLLNLNLICLNSHLFPQAFDKKSKLPIFKGVQQKSCFLNFLLFSKSHELINIYIFRLFHLVEYLKILIVIKEK